MWQLRKQPYRGVRTSDEFGSLRHRWQANVGGGSQIAMALLLCRFHIGSEAAVQAEYPANPNRVRGQGSLVPTHGHFEAAEQDHQNGGPNWHLFRIQETDKVVHINEKAMEHKDKPVPQAGEQTGHSRPIIPEAQAPKLRVRH